MKYSILLSLLCCSLNLFSQTCIILNKTEGVIYVGSDSRGGAFKSVPGNSPSILCKINSVGKFNFAISGVGFPMALEECKKACPNKTTFLEVINIFVPSFIKKLQDSLEIVRQRLPALFTEITHSPEHLANVLFFGTEADSLYIAQVRFVLDTDISTPVRVSASGGPYATKTNKPIIIATGFTDEIEPIVFKEKTWQAGIVKTIKRLIQIEIKYHPDKVNGPIDILKVTLKGNEWIQRKNVCLN